MPYYTLGVASPGTFTYVEGQTEYTERLSHTILTILSDLSGSNARLPFTDNSEVAAIETDLSTTIAEVAAWLDSVDSVIQSNEETGGDLPIPAPPTVPAPVGEPLWLRIVKMCIKLAIELVLWWLRNRKKNTKNKDVTEFLDLFKAAFTYEWTDTEDVVHLVSVLKRVAEANEIQINFEDGRFVVYPMSLSVDYADTVSEGSP